jgi:hypothetical protein
VVVFVLGLFCRFEKQLNDTEMENKERIISNAIEAKGLAYGFLVFNAVICPSPKKKIYINMYNRYGQLSKIDPNYRAKIQMWKKTNLFPYFSQLGFSKSELSSAWKESVFTK